MRRLFIMAVTFGLITMLSGGCAATGGMDTRSEFRRDVDYGGLTTYQLTTSSSLPPPVQRMIESELSRALTARGLRQAPDGALQINYFATVHDETRSFTVPGEVLEANRLGYRTWPGYETHLYQITEGTLFVDLIDSADLTLIWEGSARGALKRGNPERNRQRVAAAIDALLANFPPGNSR